MQRITVDLDARAIERLRELAERERRDLRQQAAWLILAGLRAGEFDSKPEVESAAQRERVEARP